MRVRHEMRHSIRRFSTDSGATRGKFRDMFKKAWESVAYKKGPEGKMERTFAGRTYDGFREELPKRMSVTLFGALVGAYVSRKFQERNHLQSLLDDVVSTVDEEEEELWEYLRRSDLVKKFPRLHLFSQTNWDEVNQFKEQRFMLQHHLSSLEEKRVIYEGVKERLRYGRTISVVLDNLPVFRWFAIFGPLRHQVDHVEKTGLFGDLGGLKSKIVVDSNAELKAQKVKQNRLDDLIDLYRFSLHVNNGIYYHIEKRSRNAVDELEVAGEYIDKVAIFSDVTRAYENLQQEYAGSAHEEGEVQKYEAERKLYSLEVQNFLRDNPKANVVKQLLSNYFNLLAKSYRQRAGYEVRDLDCDYLEKSEESYRKALAYNPFDPTILYSLGVLYIDIGNCELFSGNESTDRFLRAKKMFKDAKYLHRYNDANVIYGLAYGIYMYERNKETGGADLSELEKAKTLFELSILKRKLYDSEDVRVLINYSKFLHFYGKQAGKQEYFKQALETLNMVYELDPLHPLIMLTRAKILNSLGCYDEAKCCLERGMSIIENVNLEMDDRLAKHYLMVLDEVNEKLLAKVEPKVTRTFCEHYKCADFQSFMFKYAEKEAEVELSQHNALAAKM